MGEWALWQRKFPLFSSVFEQIFSSLFWWYFPRDKGIKSCKTWWRPEWIYNCRASDGPWNGRLQDNLQLLKDVEAFRFLLFCCDFFRFFFATDAFDVHPTLLLVVLINLNLSFKHRSFVEAKSQASLDAARAKVRTLAVAALTTSGWWLRGYNGLYIYIYTYMLAPTPMFAHIQIT